MRKIYYWSLAASVPLSIVGSAECAMAATRLSAADRARVALLVYQSESARQADLRRGDAITRALRLSADRAEKSASLTRAELLKVSAEGAQAKARVAALQAALEQSDELVADTAQKYTAELARRDEDYARDRTVLVSTGERLLSTAEGRRVLDLYNAGGEANWQEAKAVLDEMRRIRRASDTRDTAIMYAQARAKGLETTSAVISIYEELVRDDPSQANDWLYLALLYRESGATSKAVEASGNAVRLAAGDLAKTQAMVELARAQSANGDSTLALATFERAEHAARAALQAKPDSAIRSYLLAETLTQLGSALLESGDHRTAETVYREAVRLQESLLPRLHGWPVQELYITALLGLARADLDKEDDANAALMVNKAHDLATKAMESMPNVTEVREKVAVTSAWAGDLLLGQWKFGAALAMYEQAANTYSALAKEDSDLAWYDTHREYLNRAIGGAEFELNRPDTALDYLKASEQIARKYPAVAYQMALHAALHRHGVVLAALGRKEEAQQEWKEALHVGNDLLQQDVNGPTRWVRIEQSGLLLDIANESLGHGDFGGGLQLVDTAERLIDSVRTALPRATRAMALNAARLKAELTFAAGDASRSTEIYDRALEESERIASDPAAPLELRFGRADLLLSSSKQRLALNDRATAIQRLRLAHELFGKIALGCDCPEVHRKFAETSWLEAENQVDQVSWSSVASLFRHIQSDGFLNDYAKRLSDEALARAKLTQAHNPGP